MRIASSLFAMLAGAMLALCGTALAQTWPSHTITAVIPFAAGNANDIVGRVVLEQVSRQLGQPIIIENRAGAGGTIGVGSVAKAAPDGYTILVHSSSFSAAHVIYKTLPYDTLTDFAAVAVIGLQPTVLITAPSKGFKTAAELIAAAKANPGSMNYASAGIGAASHLAAERFRLAAGITGQHVPFRGPTEALTEVMAGRIDFYFLPISPALPLIKEGKLVALAVSTSKRAASLPDVPTTAEIGLKDAAYHFWTGLFVPVKTPRDIVAKLHDETQKAVQLPAIQERLAKLGVDPLIMTPAEFELYFKEDVAATVKLAEAAGIQKQ
jgi:tripartite-type tricarboxylate transporter receptor subunit TctC